jgi:hypothetical protein
MNDKLKQILIDISIVFVVPGALFYLYITMVPASGPLWGSAEIDTSLVTRGQKFLSRLRELNGLKLDTSVFESPVYQSLVDSSTPLPTEVHGRPNPFIPPISPVPPPQPTPAKGKVGASTNLNTLLNNR